MIGKKVKLVRASFLLPLSDKTGRDTRIKDGFVLIEDSKIIDCGGYTAEKGEKIIEKYGDSLQVIGCNKESGINEEDIISIRGVILPGFVKAHGHDHESPIIGIAKDEPLTEWLDHAVNVFTGFINDKREELTEQFGKSPNYITYIKARLDDIYYGITSSMVHHCNFNKYHVEDIVEANKKAGTKMIIAVGGQDRHYVEKVLDKPGEAVKRLKDYRSRFKDIENTWVIPGPDQVFSNGPEQLKDLKKWSIDNGTLIHIHSSEEPNTTKWFISEYGMTPIEYLKSIDFLDENTVLAHQVNCTENDLKIIKETGANVVHNPLANTILGSGMPPVKQMLEMGIPVVISTDGSGSADSQNILSAARCASQYQKAFNKDAKILPAQKVLEMITVDPAKMLKLNTGSIEPGKDADLVIIDVTTPNMTPTRLDNVVENLIWASSGDEIKYVISNGKILVNDYSFTYLDDERIKADVLKLSNMLIDHMESADEMTGTGAHGKSMS